VIVKTLKRKYTEEKKEGEKGKEGRE
jgi:hypothetical protein